MLLNTESLRSLIIDAFIQQSIWNAESLLLRIKERTNCSKAGIYKELGILTTQRVLIKAKSEWYLSIAWALDLRLLSEAALRSTTSPVSLQRYIELSQANPQSWRFTDLSAMDAFWMQLMFALFDFTEQQELFVILPRLWFPLADFALDDRYERALASKHRRLVVAAFSNSPLERLFVKRWRKGANQVTLCGVDLKMPHNEYFCAIEDFVISVKLQSRIQREIDEFFNSHTKLDAQTIKSFGAILAKKAGATIELKVNPKQAAKIRRMVIDARTTSKP